MSAQSGVSDRTLLVVAALNCALHASGLFAATWGMRPGTPIVPLAARIEYLAAYPIAWQLSWGIWMLCVPAVIAFFYLAAGRLASPLGWLALCLTIAAGTIDLCCDCTFLLTFPMVASRITTSETIFLVMERATGAISLIVANGLYSMASLLLTLALRNAKVGGTAVSIVGFGVTGFGLLLAAAGFSGVPWHVEWATGPTIGLYCVWTLLVGKAFCPTEALP